MKKPVVDYRQFRFSKINEPQFSHLKLLGWWIVNLILYMIVGHIVPDKESTLIHSSLDDMIPFCEIFVVPYVIWYFFMMGSVFYFLLYDVENFKKLQKYIIICQVIAIAIYIVFPTTQVRAPEFERDNIFSKMVGFLYSIDANTNACPSLHVAISIGIASVWVRAKNVKLWWKAVSVFLAAIISLSTVFIKQHSVIDGFAAVVLCLIPEYFLFARKKSNR